MDVKVVNLSPFPLPEYATAYSAGLDLRANIQESTELKPLQRLLISTGIFIELPQGYEAQVRPRSGLAAKHGISIVNSPGTIDPDYRGEIKVILVNLSDTSFWLNPGERIAQMVISRFEHIVWNQVDSLESTERGDGGFGHTGTH
jgi:dUTP pyrophosphatase